jgi:drug/metabolite transporter (DMT)-like permease
VPRFSPADLLLLFVVSTSVLGGVCGLRCWGRGTSFFRPIRADWQAVIPLGLLGVGAVPASLMVGLNTTAGSAALIMVTNPLWTAVLSFLYRPTRV